MPGGTKGLYQHACTPAATLIAFESNYSFTHLNLLPLPGSGKSQTLKRMVSVLEMLKV